MSKSREVFKGAVQSAIKAAAVGALIVWLVERYGGFEQMPMDTLLPIARSLGAAMSQITITLAGFVLTSTAIFAAFGDKPLVQAMYESGHAHALISRMYIAIAFDLATCAFAIWITVAPALTAQMFFVLIGMAISCIASLVSVMHKLWRVLTHVHTKGVNEQVEVIDSSVKTIGGST